MHKCSPVSCRLISNYLYVGFILICSYMYMRRRIKCAARAINAIWRTTVLYFPIVGKYRTVAGFAPLFLSDTLSLNKRTILGPVVA